MCFLDIFFHVRESESKLCYSLPAVLNTVLQYWGTCIFSNPSPDKLQNAWETLAALPAPCSPVCGLSWALLAFSPSPAQRSRSSSRCSVEQRLVLHRPTSCSAVFLGWVISRDPGRAQAFKDVSFHVSPGWYLPEHQSGRHQTQGCVLWTSTVIQDSAASQSTFEAGKAMLPPGKMPPVGLFWCTMSPKGQDWHGFIWNASSLPCVEKKHRRCFLKWPFLHSLGNPCLIQTVSGRKKDENF